MISHQELEDPEIPYALFRLFLEFLYRREFPEIPRPPQALDGVYQVSYSLEKVQSKVNLTLEVYQDANIVRATETMRLKSREASGPPVWIGTNEGEGWGVITPERNLLIFMNKKPYGDNYYYLTIAASPELRPEYFPRNLAMFRHEYPLNSHPVTKTLRDLMEETKGGTLFLKFAKSSQA